MAKRITRRRPAPPAAASPAPAAGDGPAAGAAAGPAVPVPAPGDGPRDIIIRGARQHNLKNIDVAIPRHRLVVITGPSGSGKSSLAFDTLYAEGQRRYVESLSTYARQFLDQMQKPEVDHIEGLSPAIAIEQRSAGAGPRSIVATTTEIYDFLRLLYAHLGKPHCPRCHRPVTGQSPQQVCDRLRALPAGRKLLLLAPYVRGRKGEHRDVLETLGREGFVRARIDGQVRSLDDDIRLDRHAAHTIEAVVDRLVTGDLDAGRLTDAVERALHCGGGLMLVLTEDAERPGHWAEQLISEHLACLECNLSLGEQLPRNFSFNSPYGACPACHGLGATEVIDAALVVDPSLPLPKAIPLLRHGPRRLIQYHYKLLRDLGGHYGFDDATPFGKLPPAVQAAVLHGSGTDEVHFRFRWGGRLFEKTKTFDGFIPMFQRRYEETESAAMKERLRKVMRRQPCAACGGARLRPESLAVTVGGRSIAACIGLSVAAAREFIEGLALTGEEAAIGAEIVREIRARLSFLTAVGLGYLTLNRESGSLSGGEAQRIRLATQVGSGLTGVLYVLDEPSIGLHQRDNRRLLQTLARLRDLGNTVIVVEHDPDTIRSADHVIDLGPGAGVHGGHVVAAGPPDLIQACAASLTGQYLRGTKAVSVPARRAPGNGQALTVVGARMNNLKNLDVRLPLGTFCCVTGVSGSGKSTLLHGILTRAIRRHLYGATELPGPHTRVDGLEHVTKMIVIDQSPIGRTPRSNPATYTGAFDLIRDLFARLPEAKLRGYGPGRFSFNVKGGRCGDCDGDGIKQIAMQFLPDVYVPCETCKGRRYNRETLAVLYKGRSIADVLELTVEAAHDFFRAIPKLATILGTLVEVGLGYIHLGQAATTLSGGEAQRVKLGAELARPARGHTLYILDEPTTGLHMDDVNQLIQVLLRLRDQGNTVLAIEHNLDVIKVSDWLVDLGPEGGDAGGALVAVGTPESVAANPRSHTGQFLRQVLAAEAVRR